MEAMNLLVSDEKIIKVMQRLDKYKPILPDISKWLSKDVH